MKIGIIGLGSIGQRHARTLTKLKIKDIYALRTKKGTHKELPKDLKHIKEIVDEEEFYALPLDGIIISNPTSLHIPTLKKALQKKIPILVEKPLSSNLAELEEIRENNTSNILIGFDFRYDSLMNHVKASIDEKKVGTIIKATLYCGQYLPMWHPYADYRKEYYAKKELGGGVLRTLCHEIDIMHYLFGVPKEIIAVVEKRSSLEVDVDDTSILLCRMINKSIITIEVDYLNPLSVRKGIIFGTKGILEYSYTKPEIKFTDNAGITKILYHQEKPDWDKTFNKEMEDFIACIKEGKQPEADFNDGVEVMKVIEKAELSTETKSWEKI